MNYLAHLFLSGFHEKVMVGNFIADFVGNREIEDLDEEIVTGIMLHRQIDSFTDQHKVVRQGTKRLHKTQGKYAPVVIDILYDHLLAKSWRNYSEMEYDKFESFVYSTLRNHSEQLPNHLQVRVERMADGQFLKVYKSKPGLESVLSRMDKRTRFPSDFISSSDFLYEKMDLFTDEFHDFFPEVIHMSQKYFQLNGLK